MLLTASLKLPWSRAFPELPSWRTLPELPWRGLGLLLRSWSPLSILLLELLRYDLSFSTRGLRHLPLSLLASSIVIWVLRLLKYSSLEPSTADTPELAQAAASAGLAEGKALMALAW